MNINNEMEDRLHLNYFLTVYEGIEICFYLASGPETHHQIVRHRQLVFLNLIEGGQARQTDRDLQRDTHTELGYSVTAS